MDNQRKRIALISVYDKNGLLEFARYLEDSGWRIVSSGKTRTVLAEAGIMAEEVSEYTGAAEMLDGRVKTLHPVIHGGILARRDRESHLATLRERQIACIDMVVANLYPFFSTVEQNLPFDDTIEQIDIGGPSLLRSAAKNHQFVLPVCDPADYGWLQKQLQERGVDGIDDQTRRRLAARVFELTAAYDAAINRYLHEGCEENGDCSNYFTAAFGSGKKLRYGENPHQQATLYRPLVPSAGADLTNAEQLHGKELSYINYLDLHAALSLAREFSQPCAVIIKHATPCGVGIGVDGLDAYRRAFSCDQESPFGGCVAVNRMIDLALAEEMCSVWLENIIAPGFTTEALERLKKRSKNVRLLSLPAFDQFNGDGWEIKSLDGLLLRQQIDSNRENAADCRCVTERKPNDAELEDLTFAWMVCKHVKSNALVYARQGAAIGIGMGQTKRVDAARFGALKAKQAGHDLNGSVLASDALFPFADSVDEAAQHGVSAIIQPGGSVRDQESIDACNRHGMAMLFSDVRHFLHG